MENKYIYIPIFSYDFTKRMRRERLVKEEEFNFIHEIQIERRKKL